MAKAGATTAVLLTVLVVLAASAEMAHGVCNLSSAGIRACQPAAAIRNPTDQPSSECCAALAGADLACLCRYKNAAGVWVRFYKIDINRAMGLPGKCGLAMPANCRWSQITVSLAQAHHNATPVRAACAVP